MKACSVTGFLSVCADGEKGHVLPFRVVSLSWKLQTQPEEGERRKKSGLPTLRVHQTYLVIALQGTMCVEHYEHGLMQMTRA